MTNNNVQRVSVCASWLSQFSKRIMVVSLLLITLKLKTGSENCF